MSNPKSGDVHIAARWSVQMKLFALLESGSIRVLSWLLFRISHAYRKGSR